ncbi:MAG: serine/threonine protein kinase, partial [Gemmatimonadetes bacterium]|nr:serine/threonine protein kinase [Gemmatimonadota bacterium]
MSSNMGPVELSRVSVYQSTDTVLRERGRSQGSRLDPMREPVRMSRWVSFGCRPGVRLSSGGFAFPARAAEVACMEPDHRSLDEVRAALGADFDVMRSLGRGSAATVYLAKDRALGVPVAIKVLRPGKATDETARRRFEREARAAASLADHPNTVPVTRFGRLPDQTPYLVMHYVQGRTLEERLAAEGQLSVMAAVQILREVASALALAHEKGIVHRDVRAGNVLWDEEKGRARLTDFGIAAVISPTGAEVTRLTKTGQLLGDPTHLSPEQLLDEGITELADMYLFGILGYELLAGRGPYDARTPTDWINAHLNREPRDLTELRPEVPRELADLLRRCLAKKPTHRPSAKDVVRALAPAEASDSAGEATPRPADLTELVPRRVPPLVLIALGEGVTEHGHA